MSAEGAVFAVVEFASAHADMESAAASSAKLATSGARHPCSRAVRMFFMMSPPEAATHLDAFRRANCARRRRAVFNNCLYLSARCRQDFWRTLTKRSSV
jgi:hypothetical protein